MNEHKIRSGFSLQREMPAQKENKLVERLQTDNLLTITVFTSQGSGTAVAQWLRCCATRRKVAGSIPAGVIGIFH